MKNYYWHNIGKPYRQSWWDYIRSHNLITTGFQNKEGDKGEKILKSYKKNDIFIAYANDYGAIGVAQVFEPNSYRLVEEGSVPSDFESNHRHWLTVHWLYAVEKLGDGIPHKTFNALYGLRHPRHAKEEISSVSGVEQLIAHLRKIAGEPDIQTCLRRY